ncbi:MAG: LuxR family transcriptional regulator [Pseudomonadota bacterium]
MAFAEPSPKQEFELLASIFDATDKDDFIQRLTKVVRSCGFESFLIGLELKGVNGAVIHHVTSAYPVAWQKLYVEREYAFQDPTVAYCQKTTEPLVWHDQMFSDAGCESLLEEAQSHGVSHGISVAVHERSGRKSMLSLARDQSFRHDPSEQSLLVAYARILSSCMHVVATRLIAPQIEDPNRPKLSKQETECLQWVAKGKTSWEVGQIMHIAEPTVVFHLKNVMKKLGTVNRIQALAVAMRLGLVD